MNSRWELSYALQIMEATRIDRGGLERVGNFLNVKQRWRKLVDDHGDDYAGRKVVANRNPLSST